MSKVLLAGESWVSAVIDHKGYDAFPHTQVHIGCAELKKTTASTATSSRNDTGIDDFRPDWLLRATKRLALPKSSIDCGSTGIWTELRAPCMTQENTLAVPSVMMSVGTA